MLLRKYVRKVIFESKMTSDDPIGVPVWLEEVLGDLDSITSSKVRGLGGIELYKIIDKIKKSPRR